MKIFVIILNYNGGQDVIECLKSVLEAETKGVELFVIVVDNNSTDNSLERVKSLKLKVKSSSLKFKVIENKTNLGFSAGNNIGIKYALDHGADWVFLLNNDTKIKSDALPQLIRAASTDNTIGILGPKIYFYPGCEFHQSRYRDEEKGKVIWYAGGKIDWQNVLGSHRGVDEVDRGQYAQIEETEFVSGCAMLIKREILEKVGLLDEKFFLYYEDVDYNLKAKKAGFKILFVPQAIVWHKNIGTKQTGSPHQEYYMAKSRLIFGLRWASWKTKMALFKESLSSLFQDSRWRRRGVVDFYLGRLGQRSASRHPTREN